MQPLLLIPGPETHGVPSLWYGLAPKWGFIWGVSSLRTAQIHEGRGLGARASQPELQELLVLVSGSSQVLSGQLRQGSSWNGS